MKLYDRSREEAWTPDQKRWQVRWRDGDGKQRKQAFDYKAEADGFMRHLATKPQLEDQTRTVGDQWRTYRAIRNKSSTGHQRNIDATWRLHVAPDWEYVPLVDVRHSTVAAWATALQVNNSAAVASRSLKLLHSLCEIAIRDQVIDRNPCDQITVRVKHHREQVILTRTQLDEVAAAMAPNSLVVLTLGLTGMRWGEMAGLQVRDLDVAKKRIHIRRHVTEVGGKLEVHAATKNGEKRTITAPAELLDLLAAQAEGRKPDDPLLPAARGGIRRHSRFYQQWVKRVNDPPAKPKPAGQPGPPLKGGLGIPAHIHDLRHTAASLMIQAGADVKALQRQLGHKSATMTLNVYSHLMDTSLDDLSDAMGRIK